MKYVFQFFFFQILYRIISKSLETYPPTHLREKKEVFIMFRMHKNQNYFILLL